MHIKAKGKCAPYMESPMHIPKRIHEIGLHHPPIVHYTKLGSSIMQLNYREYIILSLKRINVSYIYYYIYNHGLSGKDFYSWY